MSDTEGTSTRETAPTLPSLNNADPGLPYGAFVAFIASIMALNALGIDSMLPALPAIGKSLAVPDEAQQQWIIVIFMLGFGSAQIVWGPLADRFGRKPIMIVGLALYALFSVAAGFATSLPMLLLFRLLQGIASSTSRVLVVSIVRDCYSGRLMARVLSLAFVILLAVPILAPSIGQILTSIFGSWRSIFFFIGAYAAIVWIVGFTRLKETLHPEYRRSLRFSSVLEGFRRVLTTRSAIGYTLASAFCFGTITGFITSVGPIFTDVFHAPKLFPFCFACIAAGMAFASFLNSHFVERFGTRRISHAAMIGFCAIGAIHATVSWLGFDTMLVFAGIQMAQMFCFGLMGSNFNSMAMEQVGDIAGSAASVQGFISTCGGALLGSLVGQNFNGTTLPMTLGFTFLGAAVVLIVLYTEHGRLFRPHHMPPAR